MDVDVKLMSAPQDGRADVNAVKVGQRFLQFVWPRLHSCTDRVTKDLS
jgi:hypothetical protein